MGRKLWAGLRSYPEVEFSPICTPQPLYADVERELAGHGFYLVDLLVPHRYHYEGTRLQTADRLLWADAVFFRATADRETRTVQALVAGAVYAKLSLMEHLLT